VQIFNESENPHNQHVNNIHAFLKFIPCICLRNAPDFTEHRVTQVCATFFVPDVKLFLNRRLFEVVWEEDAEDNSWI